MNKTTFTFGVKYICKKMSELNQNIETQEAADQQAASAATEASAQQAQQSQEDADKTAEQSQEVATTQNVEATTTPTATPEETFNKYLEEQGLTKEDIETFKKEKVAKSQPPIEEKAFADLVNFAITQKLASKDEILQYENIQKQDDTALVFDKFKSEKLASDSTLNEDEIKAMFDEEYFIGDEKRAKQGQIIIAQEAKELRTPLVGKFDNLKNEFVKQANFSNYVSQQETVVNEFNNHPIKKTVEVNGEKIEIEVKPDISLAEVKKYFTESEEGKIQNNLLFSAFIEDRGQSEKALANILNAMTATKKGVEINNAIANAVWSKAEAHFKNLAIGAKAPFGSTNKSSEATGNKEAENEAFKELIS